MGEMKGLREDDYVIFRLGGLDHFRGGGGGGGSPQEVLLGVLAPLATVAGLLVLHLAGRYEGPSPWLAAWLLGLGIASFVAWLAVGAVSHRPRKDAGVAAPAQNQAGTGVAPGGSQPPDR